MGNNYAFEIFEEVIIRLYDKDVLTADVFDSIAEIFRGTDIDWGGCYYLETKDGKTIDDLMMEFFRPNWQPIKDEHYQEWAKKWGEDDAYADAYESEVGDICDRWGWI